MEATKIVSDACLAQLMKDEYRGIWIRDDVLAHLVNLVSSDSNLLTTRRLSHVVRGAYKGIVDSTIRIQHVSIRQVNTRMKRWPADKESNTVRWYQRIPALTTMNPPSNVQLIAGFELQRRILQDKIPPHVIPVPLPPPPPKKSDVIKKQDYFTSTEAWKVFAPALKTGPIPLREIIAARMDLLKKLQGTQAGWRHVLDDMDDGDHCGPAHVWQICIKMRLLRKCYKKALTCMPGMTWVKCCDEVSASAADHISPNVCSRTLQRWNQQFRVRQTFHNPAVAQLKTEFAVPPMMHMFPETRMIFDEYCTSNIANLNQMDIQAYVKNIIIDEYLTELQGTFLPGSPEFEAITHFIANPPTQSAISRQMKRLDYQFKRGKKMFYVDGHEK